MAEGIIQNEYDYQLALEKARNDQVLAVNTRTSRLEMVRMSRDLLIENSRIKPIEEREIKAEDVVAYADVLAKYVNS